MKTKFYVLAALLMASMVNLMADETKTQIHPASGSGTEDKALGYKGNQCLFIGRAKFTENSAVAGNIVRVNGWLTGEGAHKLYVGEWAANEDIADKHLPGADYRIVSSLPFDIFLTEDMLNAITTGEKDFRVYGEGMTLNVVDLVKPGKAGALKFGKTIWTGYFWMDDTWSLEIYKEAFASIDFSKYGKMRIYYEANRTDFLMRLFTKFGDDPREFEDEDDIKLASSDTDTHMEVHAGGVTPERIYLTPTYVDIPLTETIKTYLSTKDDAHGPSLFIKCNKGSGAAFNVTDVVLLPISPDGCDNCFYVY